MNTKLVLCLLLLSLGWAECINRVSEKDIHMLQALALIAKHRDLKLCAKHRGWFDSILSAVGLAKKPEEKKPAAQPGLLANLGGLLGGNKKPEEKKESGLLGNLGSLGGLLGGDKKPEEHKPEEHKPEEHKPEENGILGGLGNLGGLIGGEEKPEEEKKEGGALEALSGLLGNKEEEKKEENGLLGNLGGLMSGEKNSNDLIGSLTTAASGQKDHSSAQENQVTDLISEKLTGKKSNDNPLTAGAAALCNAKEDFMERMKCKALLSFAARERHRTAVNILNRFN